MKDKRKPLMNRLEYSTKRATFYGEEIQFLRADLELLDTIENRFISTMFVAVIAGVTIGLVIGTIL